MKDRKTYKILTIIGAFIPFPINRIYLGEKWLKRLITLNYFYFGAWADLAYMDKRFDESMAKRGFLNTNMRDAQNK